MPALKIVTYNQYAIGTYGYIVRINTTNIRLSSITSVIVSDIADNVTDTITSATDIDTLYRHLEDSDCPNASYYFSGSILTLFVKLSKYAYDGNTEFSIIGYRSTDEIGEYVDIASEDLELFINYAIAESAQILGKTVPTNVINNISNLENA